MQFRIRSLPNVRQQCGNDFLNSTASSYLTRVKLAFPSPSAEKDEALQLGFLSPTSPLPSPSPLSSSTSCLPPLPTGSETAAGAEMRRAYCRKSRVDADRPTDRLSESGRKRLPSCHRFAKSSLARIPLLLGHEHGVDVALFSFKTVSATRPPLFPSLVARAILSRRGTLRSLTSCPDACTAKLCALCMASLSLQSFEAGERTGSGRASERREGAVCRGEVLHWLSGLVRPHVGVGLAPRFTSDRGLLMLRSLWILFHFIPPELS